MSADFEKFITTCRAAIANERDEAKVIGAVQDALREILGREGWLPESHCQPRGDRYAQYPLYVAADGGFSVVSFVWSPGQSTPIHDHTVWGVIGIHQGRERTEAFRYQDGRLVVTKTIDAEVGDVGAVSPRIGDIHRVGNVSDQVAISIHAYGGDIGRVERHVFDEQGGSRDFVSGYEPVQPLLID
ncbi:MAG: cysteine dioxygenase [Burkholderiaceae bacterium]